MFYLLVLMVAVAIVGPTWYEVYYHSNTAPNSSCPQEKAVCLYKQGNDWHISHSNETQLSIPQGCQPISCRVSINFTVSGPETIVMAYRSSFPVYAELDWLPRPNQPVQARYSPGGLSGFIEENVGCNFGPYILWFSGLSTNDNGGNVSVDLAVNSFNYNGSCG